MLGRTERFNTGLYTSRSRKAHGYLHMEMSRILAGAYKEA
jgi:hypothetical protein